MLPRLGIQNVRRALLSEHAAEAASEFKELKSAKTKEIDAAMAAARRWCRAKMLALQ